MDINEYVADALRREAASKRTSGSAMARKSGKTQSWVSNRMTGKVPMDVNDLVVFADLLDVPIKAFIPDRGQLSAKFTPNDCMALAG